MRRVLYHVAGIDAAAIDTCPRSDKIWAAQLGATLLLSFTVVSAITYFSVSYFIENIFIAASIAIVVALTVSLFDRALFQSDWFDTGLIHDLRPESGLTLQFGDILGLLANFPFKRFIKIVLRLAISLLIALTLCKLVELAIFGATLRTEIETANARANEGFTARMNEKAALLTGREDSLVQRLAALDARTASSNQIDLASRNIVLPDALVRDRDAMTAAMKEAAARTASLESSIAALETDIYAEQNGVPADSRYTGLPGCGTGSKCSLYQFRLKQQQSLLASAQGDLKAAQALVIAKDGEIAAFRVASRLTPAQIDQLRAERQELQGQLDRARQSHAAEMDRYRDELVQLGHYTPLRDDPLVRLAAFERVKQDPEIGTAISYMSLMIQAFVAFLELAPVIAKIFFSPPSAYGRVLHQRIVEAQAALNEAVRERVQQEGEGQHRVEELLSKLRNDAEQRARVNRDIAAAMNEGSH